MCKKIVLVMVVVLGFTGSAWAVDFWCSGGDWADPATWGGGGVPSSTEAGYAYVEYGNTANVTTAGQSAFGFIIGYDRAWGGSPLSGTVNVAAGITFTVAADTYIGHMGGLGYLNVNGTVNNESSVAMANWNTVSTGTVNVNNGGAWLIGGPLDAGQVGTAVINLNGNGYMLVNSTINLNGGKGHIDIESGSLKVLGDYRTQLQGYIDNGWITGYNGVGTVNNAVFEGGYTVVTAIPEPATMILLGLGGLLLRRRSA